MWLWVFSIFPFFTLKGLVLILGDNFGAATDYIGIPAYRNIALFAALLGIAGLLTGYYSSLGTKIAKQLPSIKEQVQNPVRIAFAALILGWIGDAATIYIYMRGWYGYIVPSEYTSYHQVLVRIGDWRFMSLFVIFWQWVRFYRRDLNLTLILLSAIIPHIVLDAIAGGRSRFLTTTLFMAAAYFYSNFGKIKWRSVFKWSFACLVIISLSFSIFTKYRSFRNEYGNIYTVIPIKENIRIISQSINDIVNLSFGQLISANIYNIIYRLDTLDMMALFLATSDDMKEVERQFGINHNLIKELTIGWIPRAIWPEKPAFGEMGRYITAIYFGHSIPSSSAQTAIGDLYRNFGWTGIVVGMIVAGVFMRAVYRWLIFEGGVSWERALLYFLLISNIGLEPNYSTFITSGIRIAFFGAIFIFIVRRAGKRQVFIKF
jgi:hypothetical protein